MMTIQLLQMKQSLEDHEHNDKKTASLRVNLMKIMLNLNHSLRIKLILQMKNLKRTHLIKEDRRSSVLMMLG